MEADEWRQTNGGRRIRTDIIGDRLRVSPSPRLRVSPSPRLRVSPSPRLRISVRIADLGSSICELRSPRREKPGRLGAEPGLKEPRVKSD
jgi:hypothetical protein